MVGESLINIESLPDELLLTILVRVPPQDILNGARLVCRKWYQIIKSPNFIHVHLQLSPPGLLIQYPRHGRMDSVFVSMQQGRVTVSALNYHQFKSYSTASCNGLIVDPDLTGGNPTIYVVNPATQQRCALRLSLKPVTYSCAVMAYAAPSMKYKMVLTYSCDGNAQSCVILTAGVDMYWRHVDTGHLPITATESFDSSPLIAGGFIHWPETEPCTGVLTLNVETEVFTLTPVPHGYETRLKSYLSTGSCLTMLVPCSDFSWEVWELKQDSGEWMKMFNIDVGAQKFILKELVPKWYYCTYLPYGALMVREPYGSLKIMILEPVGWLNYGEVLVLHASYPSGLCFLYNVSTQRIVSFVLNHNCDSPRFRFHRNSLVQLLV